MPLRVRARNDLPMRVGLSFLALALLASCGLPEARLRAGLEHAGIHPRMARCMAERMARRLSIAQLREANDLDEDRVRPGEVLQIPSG